MTDTRRAIAAPMPGAGRLLAAQVGYQARLLASGRAITIGIVLPVLLLISAHARHTGTTTSAGAATYAVFGLTLTAWNTYGVRLVAAREAGVLKRWRATPLPRWCYFLGRILATVVVATVAGVATVAAAVLLYHTHLTVTAALGALIAFVLGASAWAAAATALTSVIPTVEAAAPTLMLTYFPILIISGVLGSFSEPHWLTVLVSYLPAQPLAHAAGTALAYTPGHVWLPARDLVVLAAWALGGIVVALVTFRWEPNRPAQRRTARKPRRAGRTGPGGRAGSNDPATTPGHYTSASSGAADH